jgi:hypothetical protein
MAEPSYTIEQSRVRVRFERDGMGARDVTVRIKVPDEQAVRQWGQIALPYQPDSEQLTIQQFQVLNPDGSVKSNGAGDVQDLAVKPFEQLPILVDVRQKLVTASALRPGDILQFSATWAITHPLAPGQFWFETSFDTTNDVRDDQLEIDVPVAAPVLVRSRPGAPAERNGGQGMAEGDRRIYR